MPSRAPSVRTIATRPRWAARSPAPRRTRHGPGGCSVVKKLAAADAAAFVNTCMIRNLDLNDIIQGGHPSDCLGALLAVAPQGGASGEKLITAMVIVYEITMNFRGTKVAMNRPSGIRKRARQQITAYPTFSPEPSSTVRSPSHRSTSCRRRRPRRSDRYRRRGWCSSKRVRR